jgi:hypothetical protein
MRVEDRVELLALVAVVRLAEDLVLELDQLRACRIGTGDCIGAVLAAASAAEERLQVYGLHSFSGRSGARMIMNSRLPHASQWIILSRQ